LLEQKILALLRPVRLREMQGMPCLSSVREKSAKGLASVRFEGG
jgi:hypothetical protein